MEGGAQVAWRRLDCEHAMVLPRLYAILDAACFADGEAMLRAAAELAAGGVTLIQYRDKSGDAREMLDRALELKRRLGERVKLIMNDRADLCLAAEFEGLHVGQDDLSPDAARRIIGPDRILGVSTHNPEQLAEADRDFGRLSSPSARPLSLLAKPIRTRSSASKACAGQGN